jgi:hypothetical protein
MRPVDLLGTISLPTVRPGRSDERKLQAAFAVGRRQQGTIVLGSGGDCCKPGGGANLSDGTFYEGCIVSGYPSDATEDAVQANIVAAGYGK